VIRSVIYQKRTLWNRQNFPTYSVFPIPYNEKLLSLHISDIEESVFLLLGASMPDVCVYKIPILGAISVDRPLAFHIDDIHIEFFQAGRVLTEVLIQYEILEHQIQKPPPTADFLVNEPRQSEIEEITLHISNGFSLFTSRNVEILFESRSIQWLKDEFLIGENNNVESNVELPSYAARLSMPLFIRSVLTGCIVKRHDPAVTFYARGSNDASAHRYIEAFYNLFFFLEYLYGNGKSGPKKVLEAFMSSEELRNAIEKVIAENPTGLIVSREFSEKLGNMSTSDVLEALIDIRGTLHHPNHRRPGTWSPGKQSAFSNESIFLQFVCMNIAFERYFPSAFTPVIEKAYKKVERCLRRGSNIRVVTK